MSRVGSDARIVERGFTRYDGERSGVLGAMRSVTWQSIRATLGLGRLARHKMFPIIAVVIAYVPAIVFVGVAVLSDESIFETGQLVSYADYYGYISAAIILFAALVAPEVLVGDRRNGMLALYLSTPLHRGTYLAAKTAAVASTLALVTLGPPLLMLIVYTVENQGPDGFGGWLATFVRVVASGAAVSAALTSVSMGVSCLTDRRAFAGTAMVLLVLTTPALGEALVDGADLSPNWRVVDLITMPFELVNRIYGDRGEFPEISTTVVVGANLTWTVLGIAVVAWRYRRLVVAK